MLLFTHCNLIGDWEGTIMSCRTRGSTLIELLVVISIISVLIAILLPALAKARETARSIQCLAHVRQILVGYHIYADTYNDWAVPWSNGQRRFIPTGVLPGGNDSSIRYWPFMMKDFINLPDIPNTRLGTGMGAGYYDQSALNCPTFKPEFRVSSPVAPHIGMMRYGFGGENWSNSRRAIRRRDEIRRPSATIGFSDTRSASLNMYGGGQSWVSNATAIVGTPRHNGNVNYGYADGHGETGAYGTDTEPSTNFYNDYKFGGGFIEHN